MVDLIGEAKDFIVSIGTETLKEKGEIAYNERKIKSELMDYTNRELKNFENIDRNYEIDFENLKVYIIEKLIGDFRESLYGDIDKREQRKKSILECLYSCVQADSYEKKQYVEKIFFNAYAIIENYYDTYIVKSEYVYLANKIVDDVHKDVKKYLELVDSSLKGISPERNQQSNISMVQYGDKNQQIGQISSLIINND
ncbi:MAG: hypothetical protein K2K96_05895 [Lachnospiraceae bacterium]|nr:hypothetical protein [Lachnospiraceae bacterium]